MIGTSVWWYIFIQACIFFLHGIAPISILVCLTSLASPLPVSLHLPWQVKLFAALESAFYLLVYHPRRLYLQRAATHPTLISREHRGALFQRCLENIPDPERYLQKWFMGAPASDIKQENVKDFFRWAFLNTGEVNIKDEEELDEYVGKTEHLLGRKFEPGRGTAKCLRLTLDKVDMLHRSLTWYMVGCYDEKRTSKAFHGCHFHG